MPSTVRLHRVFSAPPGKIYRAFLEADAIASWLPPFGFVCTVHMLEATVGGAHRMSFRNFTTGNGHSFGGTYIELVPDKRLVYTDRFDDPNLPGELRVTVDLKAVSVGTEVTIVQEGIPDVIPPEACYLGWQDSLFKLGRLVEPDIQ
jgi:uncharacterized protein YndB with AHSA1/START domain